MSFYQQEGTLGGACIVPSGEFPVWQLATSSSSGRREWNYGSEPMYRWDFDQAPADFVRFCSPYQIRVNSTGGRIFGADFAEFAMRLMVLAAPTGVASGFDLARSSKQLGQTSFYTISSNSLRQSGSVFRSQLRMIQGALALSVSDVSSALGVSRQAVYKWLSGGPMSEMNQERFEDLFAAANLVSRRRLMGATRLNRLRNSQGLTLLSALLSGGTARSWVEEVCGISLSERSQRKMLIQRESLGQRRASALQEFGVPLLDEQED